VLTLFHGGEVYAPEPLGRTDVLAVAGTIARIGNEDADLTAAKLECTVVDARDCVVAPGFIDVHAHLVGTGGEQVGVGELAIADFRATEPSPAELARIASSSLVGGLLEGGGGAFARWARQKQAVAARAVLDNFEVPTRHLYPTHVERTKELLEEAMALVVRGAFVDFECIEPVGTPPIPQTRSNCRARGGSPLGRTRICWFSSVTRSAFERCGRAANASCARGAPCPRRKRVSRCDEAPRTTERSIEQLSIAEEAVTFESLWRRIIHENKVRIRTAEDRQLRIL
jgi:hypothetical protein